MKRRLAALAIALPLAAFGLTACGGGTASWDVVEKDFMSGCEGGGGSSMPGYCECVFEELKANYTVADVEKMGIDSESAMNDEVMAIVTKCLEKLQ